MSFLENVKNANAPLKDLTPEEYTEVVREAMKDLIILFLYDQHMLMKKLGYDVDDDDINQLSKMLGLDREDYGENVIKLKFNVHKNKDMLASTLLLLEIDFVLILATEEGYISEDVYQKFAKYSKERMGIDE